MCQTVYFIPVLSLEELKMRKSPDVPPTLSMAGDSPLAMLMIRWAVKSIPDQLLEISSASMVTERNCGSTSDTGVDISRNIWSCARPLLFDCRLLSKASILVWASSALVGKIA